MLFVRFCCASISAFIFTISIPRVSFALFWNMRCSYYWDTACEEAFGWLTSLSFFFVIFVASLWIITWACLEIVAHKQSTHEKPRLLTHLRYGPIAVVVLSSLGFAFYERMMVQYSRWQIVHYIHSDASPWEPPDFDLYHDDSGLCVISIPAHTYKGYDAIPTEYFNDPDPWVRARALKARLYFYPEGQALSDVMKKAMADENPLVRQIAADYQRERWTTPRL